MKRSRTKMNVGDMAQVLSHQDSSHASGALLRLNDLRRDGILCDLTIKVEGREYKAHKAVMAACSDYFLNAICGGKTTATVTSGEHGSVTVDLDHVTLRGFAPLLEYAYTSNLQVNASDVIDVLSAASYMQMFKVANACSEFMRSNILWAQSRMANMSGTHPALLNGTARGTDRSASPAALGPRAPGLPPDVSSLLKATAASRAALGQPPLLIPMHSLAYDVGLQQLAASMAGSPSLLPSSIEHARNTPPAASSPNTRKLTQSPSVWTSSVSASREAPPLKRSPSPKDTAPPTNDLAFGPRSSSAHTKGGRKSLAVKLETRTDDEDSHSSVNDMDGRGGQVKSLSPTGSEPMEDSWQAIQKMYSMRMQNTDPQSERHNSSYEPQTGDHEDKPDPRSLPDVDRESSRKGSPEADQERVGTPNEQNNHTEGSENQNSNNNNNSRVNDFSDYMNDFALKAGYQGLDKSPSRLFAGGTEVPSSTGVATAAMINGAMRNAFLHQQHLRAAQNNATDSNKMVALPAVPPNGQYMSVRRRTLQSTVPKPHQCQICGSRFTRFHNLKQHIKLHSGIKPYECDECGKRFTRNYTLRLHKMKHVGIRNFRCGTCDASFTSLGEFRAHLRLTMHSHVSGAPPHGHQSPPASNSEPEDLSSPLSLMNSIGPNAGVRKYPRYDPAIFSTFQKGFLGDRTSLLSAALGGAMMNADGAGSAGSSCGGSPRMSDRSISPQDLSTKGNREEGCEDGVSGAAGDEMDDCLPQDTSIKGEYADQDTVNESMEHDVSSTARDVAQRSPSQERAESTSSEREVGDHDDRDAGSDANIDRDSEQDENNSHVTENADSSGKNNTSDRPLSLVLNASA